MKQNGISIKERRNRKKKHNRSSKNPQRKFNKIEQK